MDLVAAGSGGPRADALEALATVSARPALLGLVVAADARVGDTLVALLGHSRAAIRTHAATW